MTTRDEFAGAEFGDRRLSKRLPELAEVLARAPDLSFPKALGSEAALEATYRFLGNEKVTPDAVLAPHLRASLARCAQVGAVFVLHDSTEFRFSGPREDLGRLSSDRTHGFLGHFALAVSSRGRVPLGVLGLEAITRERGTRRPKVPRPPGERESGRWVKLAERVEQSVAGQCVAVHVMDCEADSFEILHGLRFSGMRFVIRSKHDRAVEGESDRLAGVLSRAPVVLERQIHLSARTKRKTDLPSKAKHPPRDARDARLLVSAASLTVRPPQGLEGHEGIRLNVVQVREEGAPPGVEPVEWRLLTSEAIETADDIAAIVDAYRTRWMIEEFFKALKTGCAFERRQLESMGSLLNALAILAPIAWQLLALRHLSRTNEDVPATALLSPIKLKILAAHKDTRHMPCATIREAMLAVARLGGHIRNNGDPGWIVLGRGYEDLLMMELGAMLAIEAKM